MSKWHQWSLPATREGQDVLGSYGQFLCKAASFEFAQEIEEALNRDAKADRLKAEVERYRQIDDELMRAVKKFPTWPSDPLHALAVLGEEFGELTKAILQHVYEPNKGVTQTDIAEEAIQTAAMAVRFVMSLDRYQFQKGEQHAQEAIDMPRDGERDGFDIGFKSGYNAAQPKPCKWTYHENHRFLTTSCGFTGFTVYVAGATWCRFCGGKIEENEATGS